MKKVIKIVLVLVLAMSLGACARNVNQDANKFKEEYESENNKSYNGKDVRELSIPKDNPFIYKTSKDIVDSINNNESFIAYFGFSTCPWCRSVLPSLIEVAKDNNIKEIYYVDVLNIRDRLSYDSATKEIVTEEKGDSNYLNLLNLLSSVLDDYNLTDENGKTVSTGEKRIYAPNIVVVENGNPVKMVTGIVESLTDPYMELTEEIEKDIKKTLNEALASSACRPEGC